MTPMVTRYNCIPSFKAENCAPLLAQRSSTPTPSGGHGEHKTRSLSEPRFIVWDMGGQFRHFPEENKGMCILS